LKEGILFRLVAHKAIRDVALKPPGWKVEAEDTQMFGPRPMEIMRKAAKIHHVTSVSGLPYVPVPGLQPMICQQQAMNDARLPRAVGAEDQREGADGDVLGLPEGLEVPDLESGQHAQ
jgi:hypothetical protein